MKRLNALCGIVCIFFSTLFVISCSNGAHLSSPGITASPSGVAHPNTLPATMAIGKFHEYSLPQSNSSLMRPAVDHEGRVWFGEMGHNFLAVFDPRTQTFKQMIPPDGQYGIMGVTVAPDDTIWFAEQYANYIGHYFPATGQYRTYPLPTLTIPDPANAGKTITLPYAPNDLAIDAHGNIWFTELNADMVGELHPATGTMHHYALASKKTVQTLSPYGITIDPHGMVWFTEASSPRIWQLDPATGAVRSFTPPNRGISLMEIASDPRGIIYATVFSNGLLLRLDPQSNTFTTYNVAPTGNPAGGLYGIAVSKTGEVWVTVSAQNRIARLDVKTRRFILYVIPTAASLPLGLAISNTNTIWFTEAGSNKIGELQAP